MSTLPRALCVFFVLAVYMLYNTGMSAALVVIFVLPRRPNIITLWAKYGYSVAPKQCNAEAVMLCTLRHFWKGQTISQNIYITI